LLENSNPEKDIQEDQPAHALLKMIGYADFLNMWGVSSSDHIIFVFQM